MEEEQFISKKEKRRLKREQQKQEYAMRYKAQNCKKVIKFIGWSIVIIVILIGIFFLLSRVKILPPTSSQNHIEVSPSSHIVTTKMDIRVHKHMLEHADGSGSPGIIINYNCEDFDCEPGLITKLSQIVQDFPDNVYLAPWPSMSASLVITAEGRQEILDGFDEEKIIDFINR